MFRFREAESSACRRHLLILDTVHSYAISSLSREETPTKERIGDSRIRSIPKDIHFPRLPLERLANRTEVLAHISAGGTRR
jgi:hypothetical protein